MYIRNCWYTVFLPFCFVYPSNTQQGMGSGLGLSLAQTFVRQAGGTITLESVPGRTVFRVLLPFRSLDGS